jgi:putative polymerase
MGEMTSVGGRAWIGSGLVLAAATFNLALCFVNAHVFATNVNYVIGSEVIIIGAAAAVGLRVVTLEILILAAIFIAYFATMWIITEEMNPKVLRDFLIPCVFVFCGTACARQRDGDKIVYVLILLVFGFAIFEWFWLERYVKIFNILSYYVAKGRVDHSEIWRDTDLALNGMRTDEGRTLFAVLGGHRDSSIFLEPVSAGNFAVIATAWLLARFRMAPIGNSLFMALIAAIVILADSRFAAVACVILAVARLLPLLPTFVLWLMPFVSTAGLIGFAAAFPFRLVDQSFSGRLIGSGRLIAGYSTADWFGIGHRLSQSMFDLDSGYAYAIYAVGVPALIMLWTCFSFARVSGARYRVLLGLYIVLAFFVSESPFSIKTAALAWFLLGACRNREGEALQSLANAPAGWRGYHMRDLRAPIGSGIP